MIKGTAKKTAVVVITAVVVLWAMSMVIPS